MKDKTKLVEEIMESKSATGISYSIKEIFKTLTFWLVLINIAVFIAILINPNLIRYLWNYNVVYNSPIEIWRFVTSIFTHASLSHLTSNLFGIICLGYVIEKYLTKTEYLFLYLGTGIITEIASSIYHALFSPHVVGVGASGAICGLMGFAIITLINDKKDRIKFLFEIIVGFVTVNLFVPNIDNIAHFSGLFSGLVFGFIFMKYCKHEKQNNMVARRVRGVN